ncbi:nucleoside hydrolase [Nitrospirillum iridis]|nr:nucleoside hydrolase [Nitrospirillum iridis]
MRLLIDTDTAGDDAFSLLLALRNPKVQLDAITICHGNVTFDQCVENALYTVEAAGRSGEVPVYPGARLPMMRKPLDAAYVFGKDGMSDANYPPAKQRPETRHAVDAIIDTVMAHPGEVTIIAQAPLTNLALAVMKEPAIAQAAKHLWIMGGTDNAVGNVTSAAEFNFYVDPEAAKIVVNAGFKASLLTWTRSMVEGVITSAELDAIAALDTPVSRFFTRVNRDSLAFSRDRQRIDGSIHPDALTCACALDESLVLEAEDCVVDVETAGTLTRGYSSVSSAILPDAADADPDLAPQVPNMRVIKRADRDGFVRMMTDAVR